MKLKELLADWADVPSTSLGAAGDSMITGLALDSRVLAAGNVFIALAGAQQHGLAHLAQALEKQPVAILFDPAGDGLQLAAQAHANGIPLVKVDSLNVRLGELAARYYGQPSQQMSVIGITGTNGKTSCSQFLSQLLDNCGLIGTLGWGEWGKLHKTLNTTPDALEIQRILAQLHQDHKTTVAMEVSSHGLEQGRVNGVQFKGAVFTNISRDHLDYHGTMEAYVKAKLLLLDKLGLAFAVVNLDDAYSAQILAAIPANVSVWGFSKQGNTLATQFSLNAEAITHNPDGIAFTLRYDTGTYNVSVPLYGEFNVDNVLAVLAVMLALGVDIHAAVKKLALLQPVIGRMERFGGAGQPLVIVDYAHTPDALDKVLGSLKKHCPQDLWVVFGCGGNRDQGKRPQMGAIAEQWADHVIITDDNPRFEQSAEIANAILAGCQTAPQPNRLQVLLDRGQAIRHAIAAAASQDIIVIAGKGHEDYQEINGVRTPFSDSLVVLSALKTRAETP